MRLSNFIHDNREQILSEWESFARTLAPASEALNVDELRDHAEGILIAIEEDLETPQSKEEQARKSKGRSASGPRDPTEAIAHGAIRAGTGFTLGQMVSEFRALRASVLRLWAEEVGEQGADVNEITRFNEAIDEALAESTQRFNDNLDHSKELFLGILGHDLGDPLDAITAAAKQMLEEVAAEGPQGKTATRILRTSVRVQQIVSDLNDFIRTRLGTGIPISRAHTNLKEICAAVIETAAEAHPNATLRLEVGANLEGEWDARRLGQALLNLVENAIENGVAKSQVTLAAREEPEQLFVSVHGQRPTIPEEELGQMFAPLTSTEAHPSSAQLGLGLYIAQEIVASHRGVIDVESTDEGTTFTIRLPHSTKPNRPGRSSI